MQIFVFILLSIIWGTTWLAIKVTIEAIPPFMGAAMRFIVAVIFLFLYAQFKGTSLKLTKSDLKPLFISAILLYFFDYGLIYWGEQYLSAGVTAIFFATYPLFVGIFANFVFKNELFNRYKFVGVIIGFSGVLIIFYEQLFKTNFNFLVTVAVIAIIISAVSAALSTIIVKKHLHHVNAVPLSLHQMVWGVLSLLAMSILSGEVDNITITFRGMAAVVYLGLFGSALAFVMFYWLLKKVSAITISFIIYITPVVALIADWLFFGERIALRTVIGMLLIFSGIAISQRNKRAPKKISPVLD
jgi:drug/metabolite transporter (DMT)-like permease